MIKANDLRVGNFIKFNNYLEKEKIVEVNLRFFASWAGGRSLDEMKIDEEISSYYSGVEINEEILIKCGFEWDIFYQAYCNGQYVVSLLDGGEITFSYCKTYRRDFQFMPFIKYLHQLQNIHHSVTGRELNIVW